MLGDKEDTSPSVSPLVPACYYNHLVVYDMTVFDVFGFFFGLNKSPKESRILNTSCIDLTIKYISYFFYIVNRSQ